MLTNEVPLLQNEAAALTVSESLYLTSGVNRESVYMHAKLGGIKGECSHSDIVLKTVLYYNLPLESIGKFYFTTCMWCFV